MISPSTLYVNALLTNNLCGLARGNIQLSIILDCLRSPTRLKSLTFYFDLLFIQSDNISNFDLHDRFTNMSGDSEQEYFSDGITEDIITALTCSRSFSDIARNSTFIYKGQSVDVRQVAGELHARYVVEGSIRKAGNLTRFTENIDYHCPDYQPGFMRRAMSKLDKYVQKAKELRMANAMIISPSDIYFDIRALLKCRWGCEDFFNQTIKCNTRNTTFQERTEMIKAYQNILLVHSHDG